MNYIDIIIIVYLLFACLQGFKKGFIKMLFDTVGLILAFFISKQYYKIIEQFLMNNTKLFIKAHDFFEAHTYKLSEMLSNSSDNATNIFKDVFNLPIEIQHMISNIFGTNISSNGDSYSIFVDNISVIFIRSLSFIITFLIVYILLVILSNFINTIFKLPILNITNRFFGAGMGILKSIIILYIIFALSSPIIGFMQENQFIKNILDSQSAKVFYDNNLILNYLSYKGFYNN